MRLLLVTDVFPPLRSSGAVQMRDLAAQLNGQGHDVTVVMPDPTLKSLRVVEQHGDVRLVRLRTFQAKDVGHKRRAFMELCMPYIMRILWRGNPAAEAPFDAVVWYSPTIFFGPFIESVKRHSGCPAYMIIRDIFPEWAVDMGLIKPGIAHWILKTIAQQQYRQADIVGVQTEGNLSYFDAWKQEQPHRRVEVLANWLAPFQPKRCSIDIASTPLRGKKVFVYAGNMGVAQGMDVLLGLVEALKDRQDLGFLFVGRGAEAARIKKVASHYAMGNVVVHDEIEPDEIPALYAQCHIGLVSLDSRHKSHNIPGKFISYMQSGLPVLASINPGNDLETLIHQTGVGRCEVNADPARLANLAIELLSELERDGTMLKERCKNLFSDRYSVRSVALQLTQSIQSGPRLVTQIIPGIQGR